ncbi:MAG: helix-turn-helix domain-containing GNAT family N-acetyltransferase [Alphaproteobacteria bacterium]|jgi:DNA-binding MarR family transcriptional regulator/GNAT superfamily N-acetyltransferase|nr:helix-turn-helix domain-containing GNAT family N-acetyltransferase [Alphaproteobacteria bacterium]MBU1550609.1 helix-turn-helix domain-containing GNAT family N-acetyltransferase [Alphaproteobacteria bacterium]MBU2338745.1 helix-turn-helix domain-containing GNAT family N-acetyltransferase [Alphaproteobacteria bacterium]MBU2386836.1 helix-turn-helix domain-containing GNAT family N-acetyltransferase [Alphaproteobacteria bacterium]
MLDDTTADTIRAFNRFYTNKLGLLDKGYLETPYTLTEGRILYEMGARQSVSASELNRDLGLDPAYLSRIVKKFREAGFIDSTPDPSDKRSQILRVTAKGQEVCDMLGQRSRQQIAGDLAGVTEGDRGSLIEAMRTIRAILDSSSQPASPAPVILRPHRIGDMGWLIESQATAYAREYGLNEKFEALIAQVAGKFIADFNPQRERSWIAEQGGKRVGSVLVADGGGETAKLRLLYLDPQVRGLGLGRTLVEECIRFAISAGYARLTLWTNDMLTAAIRIYETAGFKLVSEERHAMFGPECVGQTWELDLAEAKLSTT